MVLPCVARACSDSTPPLPNLHLVHLRIVSKRLKDLPLIGSAHGSDLDYTYGPGELMDFAIHFATNLDPNGGSSPRWPQYTDGSPQLMTLLTPNGTSITQDTYRADALGYLTKLFLANVTVGM
jgi:acetylcholinesterase